MSYEFVLPGCNVKVKVVPPKGVFPATAACKSLLPQSGGNAGTRRQQMREAFEKEINGVGTPLPGGELTLAELQELSTRQQQQMEAQQQVLVAKEQRLKYLRQHESMQVQRLAHTDQLRRAADRVESQEMKLRKLRALRGQAEQYKQNNGQLTTELEAVRAVFNEKEKELSLAVARVDQLTRQLQDLRSGHLHSNTKTAAAIELEKLRNELMIRNKLNEQQTNAIAAKEKLLSQRKEEVSKMDTRIHELQQRLKKRRNQEQNQNVSKKPMSSSGFSYGGVHSNVATVEPFIQNTPNDIVKDDTFTKPSVGFNKQDPKYQTLPSNVKFIPSGKGVNGQKPVEMNNNCHNIEDYPLPTILPSNPNNPVNARLSSANRGNNNNNDINKTNSNYSKPNVDSMSNISVNKNGHKLAPPVATKPRPSTSKHQHLQNQHSHIQQQQKLQQNQHLQQQNLQNQTVKSLPTLKHSDPHSDGVPSDSSAARVPSTSQSASLHPVISIDDEERQAGSGQSSPASTEGSDSSGGVQIVDKDSEVVTSSIGPVSSLIEKLNQKTEPPGHGRPITSSSDISHKQHSGPAAVNTLAPSDHPRPPNDLTHAGSATIAPHSHSTTDSPDLHQPPSPHTLNQKPAPTYRFASKNQIANTYMGRLGGAAMEKYQRNFNQLYKNIDFKGHPVKSQPGTVSADKVVSGVTAPQDDTGDLPQFGVVSSPDYPDIASDKGSYKLNTPKHIRRRHSDSENEEMIKALEEDDQELQRQFKEHNNKTFGKTEPASSASTPSSNKLPEQSVVENNQPVSAKDETKVTAAENVDKKGHQSSSSNPSIVTRRTKSILKKEGAKKQTNRISFDPLALLLDASLEGEVDLVRKVAIQVDDVSTANDEGITALHNAICAGHYEIVKFLVEFGCDVNSPDSDGWTPLHCAASCNNLPMVRFLVEHGACVFATTISDHETAADKCEEEEDGYDSCSDYLYSIQEKLGITNTGEVFAVFDYQATNVDELTFLMGSSLTVLRKGDDKEKEWWWSRLGGKEGYIPRNLLGLYPRVVGQAKVSEC